MTSLALDRVEAVVQLAPSNRRELAIIVPTFNERDNIIPLLDKIEDALPGVAWEVIFVDDDSADGSAALLYKICRGDLRVRVLRRIGRRGLSSAVAEGI